MTTKIDFKLTIIVIGGLIFNYLFWKENSGLNLLIFAILIISVPFFDKSLPKNKSTYLTAASLLFSSIMVVFDNSILAIICYYISLLVFVGVIHAPSLRTIVSAILAAITQLLHAPVQIFKKTVTVRFGNTSLRPVFHILK